VRGDPLKLVDEKVDLVAFGADVLGSGEQRIEDQSGDACAIGGAERRREREVEHLGLEEYLGKLDAVLHGILGDVLFARAQGLALGQPAHGGFGMGGGPPQFAVHADEPLIEERLIEFGEGGELRVGFQGLVEEFEVSIAIVTPAVIRAVLQAHACGQDIGALVVGECLEVLLGERIEDVA